jgi:hypothetical protein
MTTISDMSSVPPRKYLISMDTLKTFFQGALGAMTFGAYHQYTTNRMMDLNNELSRLKNEAFREEIRKEVKQEIHEELKNFKGQAPSIN